MKKDKKTIRTSPTIWRIAYDVYGVYGIPISNFLERQSVKIVFDEEFRNSELWSEIKLREDKIKFYKEEKTIIDKKISKLEGEIEDLKEGLIKGIGEEISENIQKALSKLMSLVTNEREKMEERDKEGLRYDIKKISLDDVFLICEKNNVTPKMVLPLIDPNVLKTYFDKKCEKFVK